MAQYCRWVACRTGIFAAQDQLHRQEVQALDTAIDHTQRQIRLAQAQWAQQNRDIALPAKTVVGSADPAE